MVHLVLQQFQPFSSLAKPPKPPTRPTFAPANAPANAPARAQVLPIPATARTTGGSAAETSKERPMPSGERPQQRDDGRLMLDMMLTCMVFFKTGPCIVMYAGESPLVVVLFQL